MLNIPNNKRNAKVNTTKANAAAAVPSLLSYGGFIQVSSAQRGSEQARWRSSGDYMENSVTVTHMQYFYKTTWQY